MQKSLTCCFTGHRIIPSDEKDLLCARLSEVLHELISRGVANFIAGGAIGFDMLAGEAVVRLKNEFPQIKLRLALPCQGQELKWGSEEKQRYAKLIERADEVVYTAQEYSAGCMHQRNRYMVDNSAYCIAYLKHSRGGTLYTVNYAIKQGLKICNLAV